MAQGSGVPGIRRYTKEREKHIGKVFRYVHVGQLMRTKLNRKLPHIAKDCAQSQVRSSGTQGYSTGEVTRQRACIPKPENSELRLHRVVPLEPSLMFRALPQKNPTWQSSAAVHLPEQDSSLGRQYSPGLSPSVSSTQ